MQLYQAPWVQQQWFQLQQSWGALPSASHCRKRDEDKLNRQRQPNFTSDNRFISYNPLTSLLGSECTVTITLQDICFSHTEQRHLPLVTLCSGILADVSMGWPIL